MPGKWGFRRFELTGATPCIGFGSGRQPYVTVVQSADLGERDDLPGTDGLDRVARRVRPFPATSAYETGGSTRGTTRGSTEDACASHYLIRGASRTPTGPPALVMAPSSL